MLRAGRRCECHATHDTLLLRPPQSSGRGPLPMDTVRRLEYNLVVREYACRKRLTSGNAFILRPDRIGTNAFFIVLTVPAFGQEGWFRDTTSGCGQGPNLARAGKNPRPLCLSRHASCAVAADDLCRLGDIHLTQSGLLTSCARGVASRVGAVVARGVSDAARRAAAGQTHRRAACRAAGVRRSTKGGLSWPPFRAARRRLVTAETF